LKANSALKSIEQLQKTIAVGYFGVEWRGNGIRIIRRREQNEMKENGMMAAIL
jgi:hypothetical protein